MSNRKDTEAKEEEQAKKCGVDDLSFFFKLNLNYSHSTGPLQI